MLIAKDIEKGFPEGEGKWLDVLTGVELQVANGEFIAITGESGVGKSTLLHILGLLDTPDSGEISIDGEAVENLNDKSRAGIRMRKIGFVFQFHHLLPEFTALENVAMPLRLANISEKDAETRAQRLLKDVGLSARSDHFQNALSGGEQQRVALARALACEPEILMADEPTGNLDEKNAERLTDLLFKMTAEKKMSVILATHNRDLAALAESIYLLEGGALKNITGDLKEKSGSLK